MNIKVKKILKTIFTSLHIMASCLFVFKQGYDIYFCKFLYVERYFNVIAALESNYSFPHNNVY